MTSVPTQARVLRRRLKPADRRDQIVEVATRLVNELGYANVTLGGIADAVGVQKSSVLHHFPSMAHIMCAVLLKRDIAEPFPLDKDYRSVGPSEARDLVTAGFLQNLEQPELIRLYAVLGAEAMDETHPAHSYFLDRSRNSRKFLTDMLSWKDEPEIAGLELLAFWQGLELELVRAESIDHLAAWNSFCDRFFAS